MEAYEHSEMQIDSLLSIAYSIMANAEAQKNPDFHAFLDTLKAFDIDEGLFMLAYSKRLEQLQKEGKAMIIKAIQTGLLVGGVFGVLVFVLALPFVFFDELYNALEKGGKHGVFGLFAIALYVFIVMAIFVFSIYLATGGK